MYFKNHTHPYKPQSNLYETQKKNVKYKQQTTAATLHSTLINII